ncbi:hypothetical protein OB2597_04083 [Pseudooceanicola batsensis HTCC2597]|uniref:Antifreeze glycopeptide polyprotein n=1 Tax=Pseudooceanicola batsensis (strain ATCC BAA-863 / DSM 15984 / KCTC 12145 / HTCC2597) TaxID=252305 RepID=A3U2L3_PSEBH|nr:hypothetical protein [Pseudooceanicola batsensis]EAQ01587.1 hypothetical protein OB2597_04083 [Pseudooceanicola batsensis HTCC2597]
MRTSSAIIHRFCLAATLALTAGTAPAREPISAIDWLDRQDGLAGLGAQPDGDTTTTPNIAEPPVADSVTTPQVETRPLDAPQAGAVGLLPRSVTGLPVTIWENSQSATLTGKLERLDVTGLPAMQSLLYSLLLTEAEPPRQDRGGLSFLLARIDALIELGAVEPALSLTERAAPETAPALFSRWFDLALLTGNEHRVCQEMRDRPALAPSLPALAFCRASQGQWDLAALTVGSAAALEMMPAAEESLMRLYLDPDLAEATPQMPPPATITPLSFRLAEAIGHPLPATGLPRAYAMADLRGLSGWRAEIEAAERLTRTGALAENRLLGVYTDRKPAASGAVWDRVEAVQDLDAAIRSGASDAISAALPPAWKAIRDAELEVPFARLWSAELTKAAPTGAAARLVFEIAMLSPDYETHAAALSPVGPRETFLAAVAGGDPSSASAPDATARAIQRGFSGTGAIPDSIRLALRGEKLGEAILEAMSHVSRAAEGATKDIAPALATLRAVGLEDTARRTALQLMILDRLR